MIQRDKLIELIQNAVNGCAKYWAEVIADYLLANGVIVPPCKVGDTVYINGEYQGLYEATVRVFFFGKRGVMMIRTTKCDIPVEELGKTVFLTREEAEKALKEREQK